MSDDTKTTSNLPALRADAFAALRGDPAELLQTMRDNVGGGALTEFDLDRVKVPAGGATTWEVPGLETSSTQALDGIIVHWREPRAYWSRPLEDSGGSAAPDCSSPDGVRGVGDPGGACEPCPLNQWGTATRNGVTGRGKACRQTRLLLMLRPDDLLPVAVIAPPTSLGPLRKYFLRLVGRSMPYHSVVTRLRLARVGKDGKTYSQIVPSVAAVLDPAAAQAARAYAAAVEPAFRAMSIDREDVVDHDGE